MVPAGSARQLTPAGVFPFKERLRSNGNRWDEYNGSPSGMSTDFSRGDGEEVGRGRTGGIGSLEANQAHYVRDDAGGEIRQPLEGDALLPVVLTL